MGWYSRVSRDINQIPAAIQHFENELTQAKAECKLVGNVEKAASLMPGIVEHRFNQLQEIEAILEYLNIELRKLRSSFFRKYLENYQRALSSRDVEKYVDGETDVVE
jgi:conjugal transfer/entry exclusion protein